MQYCPQWCPVREGPGTTCPWPCLEGEQVLATALVAVQAAGPRAQAQPERVESSVLHPGGRELCEGAGEAQVDGGPQQLGPRSNRGRPTLKISSPCQPRTARCLLADTPSKPARQAAALGIPVVVTSMRVLPGSGCGGAGIPSSLQRSWRAGRRARQLMWLNPASASLKLGPPGCAPGGGAATRTSKPDVLPAKGQPLLGRLQQVAARAACRTAPPRLLYRRMGAE